jgi:cGMP-dependent protein kinase
MLDRLGYPKLIDFGTAKVIQDRAYTIVGTPHYMAPEVILGNSYSFSVDIWSLGIMLYEFVCGIVPFGEDIEDTYAVYEAVIARNLIYPAYVNQNMKAKSLIDQLLSRNPGMRSDAKTLKSHPYFDNVNWDDLHA